jgi:hypothetical protein
LELCAQLNKPPQPTSFSSFPLPGAAELVLSIWTSMFQWSGKNVGCPVNRSPFATTIPTTVTRSFQLNWTGANTAKRKETNFDVIYSIRMGIYSTMKMEIQSLSVIHSLKLTNSPRYRRVTMVLVKFDKKDLRRRQKNEVVGDIFVIPIC